METKTTLKVVRTRIKRVLIYLKIENATLSSLPWTQVANFISKRDNILQLCNSNSLVYYLLLCPPLISPARLFTMVYAIFTCLLQGSVFNLSTSCSTQNS